MGSDRETSAGYRIVGIDPGLRITGYGCIEYRGREPVIIEAGTIAPAVGREMGPRIADLHAELSALLAELKPDLAAIEKLYSHYRHPRTAVLMGHARGVILLACVQAGVSVLDLPATTVKRSLTGNGHASKEQVQRAIQAVCALPERPEPPDVADALALALCAGRKRGTASGGGGR